MRFFLIVLSLLVLIPSVASAQLPPPPTALVDFPMPYAGDFPAISATDLLDKRAGKNGPIVARDGHFYTGDKRIRFWGVNIAFAGNFPTHEQADATAKRLSVFGINAVRFHHMDNQVFPNGIWADKSLEKLSPEALDRLDYFISALAKQGVYANLNLHVSRPWSKAHNWPNAEQLGYDKIIDTFHPDLIAANKQYARDLLTHVNAYTGHRYADEPSVCMVEINNEDTLFTWGGEQAIAKLPEPYAGMLNKLWNDWLAKNYGSREKLKAAWSKGELPLSDDLLTWTLPPAKHPRDYDRLAKEWFIEQHDTARMTVRGSEMPNDAPGIAATISKVDGTNWHLQISRPGINLEKGKFYTVTLDAMADKPTTINLGVGQTHAPWENLGLATQLKLTPEMANYSFGFVASVSDDNARISLVVGQAMQTIHFTAPTLREGGRLGLRDTEDAFGTLSPVASHAPGASDTAARNADWFDFLQQTDEAYFVGMRDFLKNEIGVKAPITGTIGLGPLGLASQSQMDFVDAHDYWDHPQFPHKAWDMSDWKNNNRPMVDTPDQATLWPLAATRVAGKPFTVTEYNHAAPNEWAAECVPMIASFAALQDWDGVFLFAYSHNADFDKQRITSFFDIEGDPTKMPLMPLAARMFLARDVTGGITPLAMRSLVGMPRQQMLDNASRYYYQTWPFVRDQRQFEWQTMLQQEFALAFQDRSIRIKSPLEDHRVQWTATGAGTGRYSVADSRGVVFAGFKTADPVELSPLRIESMQTPFASIMLAPADPTQPIESADRIVLAAVARAENTDMKRSADRTTVGRNWGKTPVRIEVVKGEISIAGWPYRVFAVHPDGTRGVEIPTRTENGRQIFPLGTTPTLWYEIERLK